MGYKAGLTSLAAQEKFGVDRPLLGVLLQQMLLPNGAVLPANFGARPMTEGDLMVRVGSDKINQAINQAKTIAEVLIRAKYIGLDPNGTVEILVKFE